MTQELIERLRNRIHDSPMPAEHLMDEAADAIVSLQARVAELEGALRGLYDRIEVAWPELRNLPPMATARTALGGPNGQG